VGAGEFTAMLELLSVVETLLPQEAPDRIVVKRSSLGINFSIGVTVNTRRVIINKLAGVLFLGCDKGFHLARKLKKEPVTPQNLNAIKRE
jgi:hypothetical protein